MPVALTNILYKILKDDKITTKILNGFGRKEKTTAMLFDIVKSYDKINRNKTLEHENTGTNDGVHLRND